MKEKSASFLIKGISRASLYFFLIFLATCSACLSINRPQEKISDPDLESLTLPDGWQIEYYARDIENARQMCRIGDYGLVIGTRSAGLVHYLQDLDKDYKADTSIVIADGLYMPNGVALIGDDLYVAEVNRIICFRGFARDPFANYIAEVVFDSLPSDRHHGWKYMAVGPDDKLYFPVGAPCNVCEAKPIYSSICRMKTDGSEFEIFAHGVRNSVGFDWDPKDKTLWFTDNGGDMMGDDMPADELNHAPEKGMHFGFPYCHQGDVPDPRYGGEGDCKSYSAPVQKTASSWRRSRNEVYRGANVR